MNSLQKNETDCKRYNQQTDISLLIQIKLNKGGRNNLGFFGTNNWNIDAAYMF